MHSFFDDNPIAALIVACEVGLWILLGSGLALRYLLRHPRSGAVVLAGIPLLDVVLLIAATLDLHRGAEPDGTHGLAAIYLGSSIAFGPALARWADVRFAHRFADGPAPVKPAKGSAERQALLWTEWRRVVTAASIASLVLIALAYLVAEPGQREPLLWWAGRAWIVAGLWLLFGPLWETSVRSSRPPRTRDRDESGIHH
ncbi:hypothetical protein [Nocardioides lijunqiniae]|uniref:hypothetical protein n=1 Tax=Nocardioides lijunqiniae TaxID=2760832 RepID=UPI001877D6D5|nr:hypothetical protein [Nocardioides lijunqiniae]